MQQPELTRRTVLKTAMATGIGGALAVEGRAAASASSSAILDENAQPGAVDWQLTFTKVDPDTRYRCPWIEGYVSHASILAGETLDIMVSTNPAGPFKIDLYRMGYYGGAGARHMRSLGPFDGVTQADPPVGPQRIRECRWSSCHSLEIPADWRSGVYLGKLSLLNDRWQSYIVFIVRDERPADIVFQCSDNTWQAYNRWPDNFALYNDAESEWALKPDIRVSYDRPYGKYCQIFDAPLSQGSGEFLLWEFPAAYWLEREGYDVTYCSNTDVHRDVKTLTRAKLMLSLGHDEYWSLDQYAHVKEAIEAGVNVGFLSGNTCCFVAPLTPGSDGRPARSFTREGTYGQMSDKEAARMGPFPMSGPDEGLLIGARSIMPFNGADNWTVADESAWIFEATGMKKGDFIPGLVGWEFHGEPADIPGLQVVAKGEARNSGDEIGHWTATLYPGPKNNWVFNAATIWWAQGLSTPPGHMLPYSHNGRPHGPDLRVQQITRNFLDRCIQRT